ncbi:tyrosine-type recombinase/integrase [Streptosporangium saharense]|uniref:tyrosine-type recombinase/integrase n=1 Tax=Streptosporangium saharense TaxID=1706840 RepID=UPI0036CCA5D9
MHAPGRSDRRRGRAEEILNLAKSDKNARVHDARHILEQGVELRGAQAALGHSQLTTTKRYAHIMKTLAVDAARMGRAPFDG